MAGLQVARAGAGAPPAQDAGPSKAGRGAHMAASQQHRAHGMADVAEAGARMAASQQLVIHGGGRVRLTWRHYTLSSSSTSC